MIDILPPATCPRCRKRLWRNKSPFGMYWTCTECDGRAVPLAVLRRTHVREYVGRLWRAAQAGGGVRQHPCPSCAGRMVQVEAEHGGRELYLDVCARCDLVWFDPDEHEVGIPAPAAPAPDPKAALDAREALALMKLHSLEGRSEGLEAEAEWPEGWQWVPALLGLPFEAGNPVRVHPVMTWILMAAISAISIHAFTDLQAWVDLFGFVPAEAFRYGGLTCITSFFLHGGFLHLIGNMYFLWVFGDNTEEALGRWRYGLLLLLATICGNAFFMALESHSMTPGIGASGGISGVIAYYALRFSRARLVNWMIIYYRFVRISMPAWMGFVFWIVLQGLGAWLQHEGLSNVNAMAHLGGAAVGVAFWIVERQWARAGESQPA